VADIEAVLVVDVDAVFEFLLGEHFLVSSLGSLFQRPLMLEQWFQARAALKNLHEVKALATRA